MASLASLLYDNFDEILYPLFALPSPTQAHLTNKFIFKTLFAYL